MAFIGRERELEALGQVLQSGAEGEPTRVALSGPLGIGISHLIDELTARISKSNGVTICRARSHAPTAGVPYGALRDALAEVLAGIPDDRLSQILGNSADDVANLIPAVAERLDELSIEPASHRLEAPDQRGARVRESLFTLIARLSAQKPFVLIVEDLENSDPGTRGFVSAMSQVESPTYQHRCGWTFNSRAAKRSRSGAGLACSTWLPSTIFGSAGSCRAPIEVRVCSRRLEVATAHGSVDRPNARSTSLTPGIG